MTLTIGSFTVFFSKFFSGADKDAVLAATPDANRVIFLDTAATPVLVETVSAMIERGQEVIVRDHHRGEGRTPEAFAELEALLEGTSSRLEARADFPACSLLVEAGEFAAEGTVIVADPDLDGLTAAMKATGVVYPELDADAAVFDQRPKQSAETLSELGWLAVRALGTLPRFDKTRPERSRQARFELYQKFVAASQGDAAALAWFQDKVANYEAQVAEAERLITMATQMATGVWLVDTVSADRYDLNILCRGLESQNGAQVTVIRKRGFLSVGHGDSARHMYSLAVEQTAQADIDLRTLIPEGTPTGKDEGLISNVSFLLHCSEEQWNSLVLPALQECFGA